MPKGYAIVTEEVTDEEGMGAYSAKAIPTILGAGANVLAAGPVAEVTEGEWHGTQTIVLEFESVEAAQAWYHSAEYQEAVTLRQAAANCNFAIIGGFEMPGG